MPTDLRLLAALSGSVMNSFSLTPASSTGSVVIANVRP
jgi:hypothetical protein